MPNPTREQFNAAAKKVTEMAPAGLSREDFYALVDKELAGASAPTAAEMLSRSGRMAPPNDEHEPDTKLGGIIKGLKREFDATSAPGAEGMAHPQTAGDFLSLLLPSGLGMGRGGMDLAKEAVGRYGSAIKTAGAETKGVRDALTLPVRAFRKMKDALPSSNDAAVEEFLGAGRGAKYEPKPATISAAGDIVDRNLPAIKKALVPLPPQAKAPTLDEALITMLEEAKGAKDPVMRTTAPMEHPPVSEGSFKQSWPKSKKQNLGGYSVGGRGSELPSDTRMDELLDTLGARSDEATSTAAEVGSSAPVTVTDKPKMSVEEVAQALRDHYGSRDGGRMLYGDALPGSERAEALKRLAPGPSRTPLAAQERINAFNAKNAADNDTDPIVKVLLAGLSGKLLASQSPGQQE